MSLKKLLQTSCAVLAFALPTASMASTITAGGSTAIFPILSTWAKVYKAKTSNEINYQPVGSGGGIKGLKSETFVFAASDMPLSSDKLTKLKWMQFPAIVGGIVTVVNLSGIKPGAMVLNGKVLADIYMGKVKYWDSPEIKTLNKGLTLPHTMIIAVHRADGSGTTYNFSNYLSKVSSVWKSKIGFNTEISWPGLGIGAKGNAGVAAQVENIPGALGYVEYAYALENNMTYTRLLNQSGMAVSPSLETFKAAAKNAKWDAANGFNLVLTDQPGKASWPIVATTFALLPKKDDDNTKVAIAFFDWCYKNGGAMARKLDYVPMPDNVVAMITAQWKTAGL